MLSPDAAYLTAEQTSALTNEDLTRFGRMTPAFVIELRSKSDSLPELKRKMEAWIENGALVGWLVDPYARAVTVYEAGREPGLTAVGRWRALCSISERSGAALRLADGC